MNTVINIVVVCNLSGKVNLNCLQTFRLPGRTRSCTITLPSVPSIGLYLRLIVYRTRILTRQRNLNTLKALCLSGRSTYCPIRHIEAFPAIGLSVYPVGHGFFPRACFFRSLRNNLYPQFFQSLSKASCSGIRTVINPSLLIANGLNMNPVSHVIVLCKLPGQLNPDSLQTLTLPVGSCPLSVRHPVRPLICLAICLIGNTTGITRVVLKP